MINKNVADVAPVGSDRAVPPSRDGGRGSSRPCVAHAYAGRLLRTGSRDAPGVAWREVCLDDEAAATRACGLEAEAATASPRMTASQPQSPRPLPDVWRPPPNGRRPKGLFRRADRFAEMMTQVGRIPMAATGEWRHAHEPSHGDVAADGPRGRQ